MIINRAYKVELNPNNRQRSLLAQSANSVRFAYNWGLAQRIELYKSEKKSTTAVNQHKLLCSLKKEKFPWMYDVTKCAPQEALRNLDKAFKNFFKGIKKGTKVGFPKFKSKHKDKDSFRISTGAVYITKSSIKLPNIKGPIKIKEKGYIPTEGIKYNSYTISKRAGKWFLSVQCVVKIPDTVRPPPEAVIGVDLGIKVLATVSDGTVYENPKSYRKSEKRLNKLQRIKSRRVKGSSNRRKAVARLQRQHYRVACIRRDSLHKMTSDLVRTKPGLIVLEDLFVRGMLKNHKLAKSLADASFGEIRRQLEYKAKWGGSEILIVDRFYPSSKLCSSCGQIKDELKLSDRIYRCECGLEIDRDLNASLNLKSYGEFHRNLLKQKACGEERSQSVAVLRTAVDGAPRRSRKKTKSLTSC